MKMLTVLLIGFLSLAAGTLRAEPEPVRFAIVGLVHDHARGFIPTASAGKDIRLVAIVEPNRELAARYARDYRLPDTLFHTNLESMLDQVKPQAVAAFTSTFDHRQVVEACAPRGVHVMMEKPLAVDMEHARAFASAAERGGVQVMVNFETTWYPANHEAYALVHEQNRLRVRRASGAESDAPVPPLAAPENDPLSHLAAVVRGDIRSAGLSSLEMNLVATEILDAARESARAGQRVVLSTETTATERDKLLFGSCLNHRGHLDLSLHLDMAQNRQGLPPYQANEPGYAILPAIDVDVPDGVAWESFEGDSRR